jgi:hypothetical protein
MIANAAVEGDDGTVFRCADILNQSSLIDGIAHKRKKIGL